MLWMRRLVFLTLALPLCAFTGFHVEGREGRIEGCGHREPVLTQTLGFGGVSGVWRLALSADRPDLLTEARLSVIIRSPGGRNRSWTTQVEASFPDPKPFGIPYSFEKLELVWKDATGQAKSLLRDWSDECSSPGRSLFPGQRWLEELEMTGTEDLPELQGVEVRLWGSRN